jgi:hypothetical protein
LPLLYRRIAVALLAVFALLAGSATSALAQSPKPDPAPAAQHQQTTSPKSTSSGSTHVSPSQPSAPASTPAPVFTPAPATSSPPASSSTPSTSQPATTSVPKHTVTHRAKAKAPAKTTHHAKPPEKKKAKPAVHAAKPAAARPVVHSAPAGVSTLPVVPPAGSSGSSLSNRSVLLLAFVLVIAAGVLTLLVRGLWRRVWWWRQYHALGSAGRHAGDGDAFVTVRPTRVEPWSDEGKANGANGVVPDDEPTAIASAPAQKTSTGM